MVKISYGLFFEVEGVRDGLHEAFDGWHRARPVDVAGAVDLMKAEDQKKQQRACHHLVAAVICNGYFTCLGSYYKNRHTPFLKEIEEKIKDKFYIAEY